MTLNLIIAEKMDAGRRIAYILSKKTSKQKRSKGSFYIEFESNNERNVLVPLSGHVLEADFPSDFKDWLKSDLNLLIDSRIVYNVKNQRAINTLKNFKDADNIIIATDYDREGELIGTEVLKFLNAKNIKRAKFSALTEKEINDAFSNTINVDYNLADSAQAREEIDLIWGAVLTRFFSIASNRLWKDFISVGRVQTPTLGLIYKREMEIRSFVPEKYYKIKITFNKNRDFDAYYNNELKDRKTAEKIFSEVKNMPGRVKSFDKEEYYIYRPAPFNTNEFLREASYLGISPARAMNIAEKLYMQGLISYPRTDNTVYNKSINLKSIVEKLKKSEFSMEADLVLSQEKILPSRGKTEATDHPPIYPVSVPSKELTGDYKKIYELIVRRFLATLYKNAVAVRSTALIDVNGHDFISEGNIIKENGWYDIYKYKSYREYFVPDLEKNEVLNGRDYELQEKETEPPRRYDVSSLLKAMESLNLGTKSTRHDIIDKLYSRNFVTGNPVKITPLGEGFIKSIIDTNPRISEPEMTAELEMDMDKIASGTKTKDDVVNESRRMLHSVLNDFQGRTSEINKTINDYLNTGESLGRCPLDGNELFLIKYRDHYKIKCGDENCRIDFNIYSNGRIQLNDSKCPVCSLPMIKIIRKGQSPEVKCIDPACDYNKEKDIYGTCPADGGNLVLRQSRYGKRFLGCSNYPKCTVTYPLPQKGILKKTDKKCQYCGAPIIVLINGRRHFEFCPKIDCEFNRGGKIEKNKV
ncbi:DNA topoisomerase I [Picrophilus oshimae]|uniref:DNA topoisomerase 1 n=1 Tax=Picrophilus torridus (strain ATCC 700027 / DSM 9790 / JCM 10055 / NBRC 100828 / KAW 2/3) TaxID=1122961 RepID=Q6L120_PICTO|nr:DNA topoisomerase I [Picrophilus oshimae]AAT43332.1 DNA topoisomerase I [Picrophilus oshimae DSM 9789]SMD30360.1 DNA topoisomerase I [Picrophilus oshimae DSM 9789]